jgi:uncharacterized membrane protein (DUF485 family)
MHARIAAPPSEGLQASEQRGYPIWDATVESDSFAALMTTKMRCVAPLLGFSFFFIVTTTLLAGYAKDFMGHKVLGSLNVGYLLVLLTYVVCWVVSLLYCWRRPKFDPLVRLVPTEK